MGFLGVSCNLRDRQAGPAGLDFGGRRNVLHWKGCGSSLPRSRLGGQSKRSVWDRLSLHFPPLGNYIFHTHTHTHCKYEHLSLYYRVSDRFCQPSEGIYTKANDEKWVLVSKFEIQMFFE